MKQKLSFEVLERILNKDKYRNTSLKLPENLILAGSEPRVVTKRVERIKYFNLSLSFKI